jgi:vacuolar-type H+-ATPase subunit E/Vma4
MTIDKIIEKINAETAAEVDKILKDAKLTATKLRKEANSELTVKLNQIREQGKKRTTIMRNIHLSEARRMTRRSILGAKEEMISECFERASEQLRNLSGEEYRRVLQRLINQSLKLVGNNAVATLTREQDKAILSVFPSIKIKSELAKGIGGIILESADGNFVVDNTFDAILERQMEEIRTEVANILYPE